ncbi:MAG: chaplin family protein [Stackebrandtia sp.]
MTKTWARRSVQAGAIAAGFLLFSGGAAQANDVVSTDNYLSGNGNQVVSPVQSPVDVCGNSAASSGYAGAWCDGGASAKTGGAANLVSTDNNGFANGNQVYAPVQTPIDVCGNAAALVGAADAGCTGGADAKISESAPAKSHEHGALTSTNNYGALTGNQVYAPIQVPVNVCGNSVAAFGAADASCAGGAQARQNDGSADMVSSDNVGLANGNQVVMPVQVPVNVCGNSAALFGTASASCDGGATAKTGHHSGSHEAGKRVESVPDVGGLAGSLPTDSIPLDTATGAVGTLPTGNLPAVDTVSGLAGDGLPTDAVTGGLPTGALTGAESLPTDALTGGGLPTDSLTGGGLPTDALTGGGLPTDALTGGGLPTDALTGGAAPADADVDVQPAAAEEHGAAGGGLTTTGNIGAGTGNQLVIPIQVPVNVDGNAAAAVGAATASSQGGADARM